MEEKEILHMFHQMAAAIKHIHDHNILHRLVNSRLQKAQVKYSSEICPIAGIAFEILQESTEPVVSRKAQAAFVFLFWPLCCTD